MENGFSKMMAATCIGVALMVAVLLPSSAMAYGQSTMYTPPAGVPAPGALYARAMQASNGKMYATFEQYTTGVASFPIFESLDNGQTWKKVGDVKDTHKGWGMRWEPHLYQLPEAIGNMPAGTLLASGLVLPYDESKCEIDLYKSNDEGRTWIYVSTVAVGTQAKPGSDPVWEPFLMVANKKLIIYYSDERDNAYSQKLVHQSSSDGVNWGPVVNDVAIKGERPGMVTVAQMPNGKYIMTYEIVGGSGGAWFKISSDPESWNAPDKGTVFDAKGSSPYVVTMNGMVIISTAGNGNLFTNDNNAVGAWKQIPTPIGSAYSRCLVPLQNGRLFLTVAGWNQKSSLNNVIYADMAISGCEPTPIIAYTQVDGGAWLNNTSETVNVGATLIMGPHPNVTSGWSWSGPNGFSATTREITFADITTSQAGDYTATYSNPSGCKSTQKFTVTVEKPTQILNSHVKGSHGDVQIQMRIRNGLILQNLVQNSEVRVFNLNGVSVFRSKVSSSELVVPGLNAGVYVIQVLHNNVLLQSKSFVME